MPKPSLCVTHDVALPCSFWKKIKRIWNEKEREGEMKSSGMGERRQSDARTQNFLGRFFFVWGEREI